MTFLKDALARCPPPPINTEVEGACAAVVNDMFCVKLRVTGEEPLNPTLLGLPPPAHSLAVCRKSGRGVHHSNAEQEYLSTVPSADLCPAHPPSEAALKMLGCGKIFMRFEFISGRLLRMAGCNTCETSRGNTTNPRRRPQHTHKETYRA